MYYHVLYFHPIDIVHHLSNSQFWRLEHPQNPDFSRQKPLGQPRHLAQYHQTLVKKTQKIAVSKQVPGAKKMMMECNSLCLIEFSNWQI